MPERFSLRSLYLYLVCLITLVISIYAATRLVRNAVELAYPDPASYAHVPPAPSGEPRLPKEERQRQEAVAQESQRRQAILGLVGSTTTLLITVPLYAYHWRRVQRERSSPGRDVWKD